MLFNLVLDFIFLSAFNSVCGIQTCLAFNLFVPNFITTTDILSSRKLFGTHLVRSTAEAQKSHFYEEFCSPISLAYYSQLTINSCVAQNFGRKFYHLINVQNGWHEYRTTYTCDFGRPVGFFEYQGIEWQQTAICVVFVNNSLLTIFPVGKGREK